MLVKHLLKLYRIVEAYTASWIEIIDNLIFTYYVHVEAYTASWIEIRKYLNLLANEQSKPIRLRGLK